MPSIEEKIADEKIKHMATLNKIDECYKSMQNHRDDQAVFSSEKALDALKRAATQRMDKLTALPEKHGKNIQSLKELKEEVGRHIKDESLLSSYKFQKFFNTLYQITQVNNITVPETVIPYSQSLAAMGKFAPNLANSNRNSPVPRNESLTNHTANCRIS